MIEEFILIAMLLSIPTYFLFRSELFAEKTPFDENALFQTIQWNNREYFCRINVEEFVPGYGNHILVGVKSSLNLKFRFSKETWYEKLFKWIGFILEFQTGDKEFDKYVYISSDALFLHEHLAKNTTLRQAILEVWGLERPCKCKSVSIHNQKGFLWIDYYCKEKIKPDKLDVRPIVEHTSLCLDTIKQTLPQEQLHADKTETAFAKALFIKKYLLALSIMTLFLIIFTSHVIYPFIVDKAAMFWQSLALSLTFVSAIYLLLTKRLYRSSWTHTVMAKYFFVLLLLLWFPSYIILKEYDYKFDEAPLQQHYKAVQRKYKKTKPVRYFVETNSWSNERQYEEIQVTRELYNTLQDLDVVGIDVHQGRLGIEWISSVYKAERK